MAPDKLLDALLTVLGDVAARSPAGRCIHCNKPVAVPFRGLGNAPVCGVCAAKCVGFVAFVARKLGGRKRPVPPRKGPNTVGVR